MNHSDRPSVFHPSSILIDTGANTNHVNNSLYFASLDHEFCDIAVNMNHGPVAMKSQGRGVLKYPFDHIEAFYTPDSSNSLLSEYDISMSFDWQRQKGSNVWNDLLVFKHNFTDETFKARRCSERLFIFEVDEMIKDRIELVKPTINNGVVMSVSRDLKHKLMASKLTKDEIKRIFVVERLHKTSFISLDVLEKMVKSGIVPGLTEGIKLTARDVVNYANYVHSYYCLGCLRGKTVEEPARPLLETNYNCDKVECDIMNFSVKGDKEKHYSLVAVDAKSQMVFQIPLKDQTIKSILKTIKTLRSTYLSNGHTLKTIRFDGLKSFTSAKLFQKLLKTGIKVEIASPGRHARKAERAIRYIKSLAKATLADLSFPLPADWIQHLLTWVVQSINIHLRSDNDYLSPWAIFTGVPVRYDQLLRAHFLEVVECQRLVGPHLKDSDSKTFTAIIMGRDSNLSGQYFVLDISETAGKGAASRLIRRHQITRRIPPVNLPEIVSNFGEIISHFEVDESEFSIEDPSTEPTYNSFNGDEETEDMTDMTASDTNDSDWDPDPVVINKGDPDWSTTYDESLNSLLSSDDLHSVCEDMNIDANSVRSIDKTSIEVESNSEEETPIAKKKVWFNLHQEEKGENIPDLRQRLTRSANGIIQPSKKAAERLASKAESQRVQEAKAKLSDVQHIIISETIRDFTMLYGHEMTEEAMWKELKQMLSKRVWKFITQDEWIQLKAGNKSIKAIPSMMLLKAKFDAYQQLEKLKARLCALGNLQAFINEIDLAAPTASMRSLLLSIAVAAKHKLMCTSFDITGAFLNARLEEEQYMTLSKQIASVLIIRDSSLVKFVHKDGSMVVSLLKCIYGLRQSPKSWFDTVEPVITKELKFVKSAHDNCLFYRKDGDKLSLMILYVDDFLVFSSQASIFDEVQSALVAKFDEVTRKDGDRLSFLGLQIVRDSLTGDYSASLEGFIDKAVANLEELEDVKATTPWSNEHISSNTKFEPFKDIEDTDSLDSSIPADVIKLYRSRVMTAMYIAIKARPEVLVGVAILSTKQLRPDENDFAAINRILKYLVNTKDRKLIFKSEGEPGLFVFCDASYRRYLDGKGHGGCAFYFDKEGSSPFSWYSRKHKINSTSPQDCESVDLEEVSYILPEVIGILKEFGIVVNVPIVYEDNESLANKVNKERIDKTAGSVRLTQAIQHTHEAVKSGIFKVEWIKTELQRADPLSKPLTGQMFKNSIFFYYRLPGFYVPIDKHEDEDSMDL